MGALALEAQKYGSPCFIRAKVIKSVGALVSNTKRMGALALEAPMYGSSKFERSKVIKGVGALTKSVRI